MTKMMNWIPGYPKGRNFKWMRYDSSINDEAEPQLQPICL
jgi:hypothetical protein